MIALANSPRIPIAEIFYSIQGEGDAIGRPTIFVRVQGCNLGCVWCDTPDTQSTDRKDLIHWTMNQVVAQIATFLNAHPLATVTFTGGEPMLYYREIETLIDRLGLHDSQVAWETNGTVVPNAQYIPGHICISPKLASAKGKTSVPMDSNYLSSVTMLIRSSRTSEVKLVISDEIDARAASGVLHALRVAQTLPSYITFQPEGGSISKVEDLLDWLGDDEEVLGIVNYAPWTKVRFLPQLHKIGGWE